MTNIIRLNEEGDSNDPKYDMNSFKAGVFPHFQHYLLPTFSVLDLGCGNGRVSKLVSPYVKSIVGIDVLTYNTSLMNSIDNFKYLNEDIETFKSNQKFEIILSVGTFYHVYSSFLKDRAESLPNLYKENPSQPFEWVMRNLKKGGFFIIIERDWRKELDNNYSKHWNYRKNYNLGAWCDKFDYEIIQETPLRNKYGSGLDMLTVVRKK